MNLKNKKWLASRVLNVGKERIFFSPTGLKQIDDAITRQDIIDLKESGVIVIKEPNGRKKIERRKHKRRHAK
jgi:large subunit ribosomal protein L19e